MSSSATSETATVEIAMPQMGVSVAEGTVTGWLKQPGDPVEADETVCEVTTDKIDVEIPAPVAGRLAEIVVGEGETVAVGTVLARLGVGEVDKSGAAAEPEQAADSRQQTAPEGQNGEIDRSDFYSPVVRRIAAEHGIDLGSVPGHGIGGRVRKSDLLAFIEQRGEAGSAPAERPLHSESPYRPEPDSEAEPGAAPAASNGGAPEPAGLERGELMGPMRKLIGERMLASLQTSAHCTTVVEADFSAVAAARRRHEARPPKPTYLAFVAAATVEALQRHPVLNASIEGERIVQHPDVDLGIAVDLDPGLIVPVIRRAQRLSVTGLAEEIADLAVRARSGRLQPDETSGGTFTITNPGQFGALLATPIINQPQVAILDVEAIVKRPVVVEGPEGDSIGIRPVGHLCMSWDHRALDGVEAARFLADVRARIEGWDR